MRIGTWARPGRAGRDATLAEGLGAFAVGVGEDGPTVMVVATEVAMATTFARVVVRLPLDVDHPITLAEDLAVLDNVSGGRVVAMLDTAGLPGDHAIEAATLVQAGLSARPVRHRGQHWRVPAGIEGQDVVDAVQVTPEPVQVAVPLWVVGAHAAAVADRLCLPRVVDRPAAVQDGDVVAPAIDHLSGDREADHLAITAWAAAGATHLLAGADDLEAVLPDVALHHAPSVAMPNFPRVISETMVPPPWPVQARRAVSGDAAGGVPDGR